MTLNEYFKKPARFKNKIIVISAKDEASRYISGFTAASDLGLRMNMNFRASYVAVVDMKRDFVYERSSSAKIECSYKVDNRYIDIVSAGFESGNVSSVRVGDNEYSHNSTGLNVVILKNKSLKPLDSFYADTFGDATLTVRRI